MEVQAALQDAVSGVVSPVPLIQADCDLIDARIRLSEAKQSHAEVVTLLKELVAKRTEERALVTERVNAGVEPVGALNAVDLRLSDAKVRLARAEAALKQ
jgi:hypothetical protein